VWWCRFRAKWGSDSDREPHLAPKILRKDRASIGAGLRELQDRVCERQKDQVEICDRFWPYQKQIRWRLDHVRRRMAEMDKRWLQMANSAATTNSGPAKP
jgi:hypothetical protein